MLNLPTADEPVRVVEGDNRPLLAGCPDGHFCHLITDPPYSAVTHTGARTLARGAAADGGRLIDFDCLTEEGFLHFCREAVRVTRRWVLMTCDWRHAAAAERELPEAFVRAGVWVKLDSAPQLSGDRPGTGWEAVLLLHRPGRKRWNGGGHPAVWSTHIERAGYHPTGKPLPLLRNWVRLFTDPGECILDPYCGSGTTLVAAAMDGRRAVGVELDPRHAATSRERVAHALGHGTLFAPPAEQALLFAPGGAS